VKPKFFKTQNIAAIALISALISPAFTWSLVQADAETVNCSVSGSFSIASGVVTGNTACTGTATIPNTVTSIGENAFKDATGLIEVLFEAGSSLDLIAAGAFQNATNLVSIELPPSVMGIGGDAFLSATSLASINIPAAVQSIGGFAFYGASSLTQIAFDGVSTLSAVGSFTFFGSGLTSIEIPASVNSIGESAFQGSSYLSSVVFRGNAPTIDQFAFHAIHGDPTFASPYAATGFEIGVDGLWNGIPMVKFVDCGVSGYAIFSGDGTSLNGRNACTGSLTIPSGVTSIGDMAFYGDTAITSVVIPQTVTAIGSQAFQNASSLTAVRFGGNAPTLGSNVFSGITNATVYASVGATGFATNSLGKWNGMPLRQPAWASVRPRITGRPFATAGGRNKLTANKGTWFGGPNPLITYKWYTCNSAITIPRENIPAGCSRIGGANTNQLAVKLAYKGKFIAVAVTGKATGSPATTWVSKTTARVS